MADLKSIAALASLTSASGFGCYLVTDYVYDNNEKIENGWIHKEDLSKKGELPNESKDKSKEAKAEPSALVFGNTAVLDAEYRNKILGTTRKSNLNFIVKPIWENAQEWWTWSFNNKFSKVEDKSKLDTIFSAINKPYSSDNNDSTALNKACDLAYKKEKSEFNKGNLVGNIGAFCTKGSTGLDVSEPEAVTYENELTITDAAYNDGVLNKQDNKSKLVKAQGTSSDNNQLWWEWAFTKNFETNKENRSTLFGSVTGDYSSPLTDDSPTKLNQACNQAYKKNKVDLTNEEGTKLLNDIKRYCTLGKEPQDIALPVDPKPTTEPTTNRVTFTAADITQESGYKNQLLDLIKDEHLNHFVKPLDSQNQLWWYWSYNNNYSKKKESAELDDLFTALTTGYDNTNEKALNQACNKAYKKAKEDYKFKNKNYLLKNIADFCQKGVGSIDYLEPKVTTYDTVTTTNGYTDGVLNIEANAKRLVKTEGTANDSNEFWWKWKYEKVKGSLANTSFSSVNEEYLQNKNANSLNGACDAAYKKNKDDLENDNKKILGNIKSFCTKDSSGSDLTLPKEPKVSAEPEKKGFETSSLDSANYGNGTILGNVKKTNLTKFIKPTDDNKSWWRWKFQKDYETFSTKDKLTDPFKDLTLGYDKSDSKALNKACDAAYKKPKSEYKFGENDYLIQNIEKFCTNSQDSDFVTEPISTTYQKNEGTDDDYKWGLLGVEENRTKLVKVKENANETWWNWAYEKLIKSNEEAKKTIFKEAQKGFDKDNTDLTALNKICNDAYQLDKNTLTKNADNVFTQIKKFCTPGTGEDNTLQAPTLPKDPRPLKERTDLTQKYSKGISKETNNRDILVDPEDSTNEDWWNWAYRYLYKNKPTDLTYYSTTFESIKKGYDASNNTPKALNLACKEAYTKDKNGDSNFENLRKNIKQFCTKDQNQDVTEPTQD